MPGTNFSNLELFITAAKELNISKAAGKLYLSPQALSEQIRRLEKNYQISFFERTPRLHLTYAGELFLAYAIEAVDKERLLKEELSEIGAHKRGRLSVGFTAFLQRAILPEILPHYHEQNPLVDLDIKTLHSDQLISELSGGNLDLTICNYTSDLPANIEIIKSYINHFCVVIPRRMLEKHNLPVEAGRVALADLRPLLNDTMFLMNEPGTQSRYLGECYLRNMGILKPPAISLNEMNSLLLLCAKGMGVTFSFELTGRIALSQTELASDVVFLPLPEYDNKSLVYVCRNMERSISWPALEFLKCLDQLEFVKQQDSV